MARLGWLDRMTQFKEKSGKHKERACVGLYTYPVLQAADILVYKATHVPVGEDQKQHLELTRDIAQKFNTDFDAPGFFPLPEPLIQGPGARVMSLRDGTAKMSKSDPSDYSRINLNDDADAIAQKIRKAKTDAEPLPDTAEELEGRPEAANLVSIYGALAGLSKAEVLARFSGKGFGEFKPALAELAVEVLKSCGRPLPPLPGRAPRARPHPRRGGGEGRGRGRAGCGRDQAHRGVLEKDQMRPAFTALGAALAAVLAVASAAQARAADIVVREAWIPLPPNGLTNAVVFMDIVNGGERTDRLLGAACNCAARVELHEMSTAGGIMRMRPAAAGLEIPPAGAVRLAPPQGAHLMLMGLKQPLHAGEPVPLTLQFEHAGKVTVEALVRAPPALGGTQ